MKPTIQQQAFLDTLCNTSRNILLQARAGCGKTSSIEIIKAVNAKGQTSVSDVIRFIEDLFADGADHVVTLCTYHKSKGREWERVILWEHSSRCPSKYAKQDWQREQESNLAYVAITRSKDRLVFVN